VKTNEATFANVLGPLSHTEENAVHVESNILCFYKEVPTDSELRDASGEAQKLLSGFAIETAMCEDIFQLVNAIVDKNEALDPESSHLLQKQHKDTSETD
jgi:metallopeptidase MepB